MATDVHLTRSADTVPWGFSLTGGLEYNAPITVVRVLPLSLAYDAELCDGDIVLEINHQDATNLSHQQLRDAVAASGNILALRILPRRNGTPIPLEFAAPILDFEMDPLQGDEIARIPRPASPFLQKIKKYKPFTTGPIDGIPPLEHPIILNPKYNDDFSHVKHEDFEAESIFKLRRSSDFIETSSCRTDAYITKNYEELYKAIESESLHETNESITTQCYAETVDKVEVITKSITETEAVIETTANDIVAESIANATKMLESNNIDGSNVSMLAKLIDQTTDEICKTFAINEANLTVENTSSEKIKTESNDNCTETYEKESTEKQSHQTISEEKTQQTQENLNTSTDKTQLQEETSSANNESKVIETINRKEVLDNIKTISEQMKHVESSSEELNAIKKQALSTANMLTEQKRYQSLTMPTTHGIAHSGQHYDLLLKTFFIHLTDVMVALSRLISSDHPITRSNTPAPLEATVRREEQQFSKTVEKSNENRSSITQQTVQMTQDTALDIRKVRAGSEVSTQTEDFFIPDKVNLTQTSKYAAVLEENTQTQAVSVREETSSIEKVKHQFESIKSKEMTENIAAITSELDKKLEQLHIKETVESTNEASNLSELKNTECDGKIMYVATVDTKTIINPAVQNIVQEEETVLKEESTFKKVYKIEEKSNFSQAMQDIFQTNHEARTEADRKALELDLKSTCSEQKLTDFEEVKKASLDKTNSVSSSEYEFSPITPPTPLTDEYMFRLQFEIDQSKIDPEFNKHLLHEDPNIVKKTKLYPHYESSIGPFIPAYTNAFNKDALSNGFSNNKLSNGSLRRASQDRPDIIANITGRSEQFQTNIIGNICKNTTNKLPTPKHSPSTEMPSYTKDSSTIPNIVGVSAKHSTKIIGNICKPINGQQIDERCKTSTEMSQNTSNLQNIVGVSATHSTNIVGNICKPILQQNADVRREPVSKMLENTGKTQTIHESTKYENINICKPINGQQIDERYKTSKEISQNTSNLQNIVGVSATHSTNIVGNICKPILQQNADVRREPVSKMLENTGKTQTIHESTKYENISADIIKNTSETTNKLETEVVKRPVPTTNEINNVSKVTEGIKHITGISERFSTNIVGNICQVAMNEDIKAESNSHQALRQHAQLIRRPILKATATAYVENNVDNEVKTVQNIISKHIGANVSEVSDSIGLDVNKTESYLIRRPSINTATSNKESTKAQNILETSNKTEIQKYTGTEQSKNAVEQSKFDTMNNLKNTNVQNSQQSNQFEMKYADKVLATSTEKDTNLSESICENNSTTTSDVSFTFKDIKQQLQQNTQKVSQNMTKTETDSKSYLEGYRSVKFDAETIKTATYNTTFQQVDTHTVKSVKFDVQTNVSNANVGGTTQGIMYGLESAFNDEDMDKEMGKPGLSDEKIAELISGEAEMLKEAHVIGLRRVLNRHMYRHGENDEDDSSVNFKKLKPQIESLKDSEVLKALNEEILKTREEKKKEERKWTTFLQKPSRPVPKSRYGHQCDPCQPLETYKVKIVKQPKPKVAPDYKPEVFETGPLPWELRAANEPPPPPVPIEEPILIPEDPPEFLEALDNLPESEVPDLEDTGIVIPPPIPPHPEEYRSPFEEPEVELREEIIQEQVQELEEDIEMDQEKITEKVWNNIQNLVDPNASVEDQLHQMQAQLAALATLPAAIHQTLELVTKQLGSLTVRKEEVREHTECIEVVETKTTETIEETCQQESTKEQCTIQEVCDEKHVDFAKQASEEISEEQMKIDYEEMERMRQEEETMRAIEKQKKELMAQLQQEHVQRQLKQRPTPQPKARPKPAFGPIVPQERPLFLPGGRIWRHPKDAYNDEFIRETLTAQAELIQGKTKGGHFESHRLEFDQRVNFMKYQKPPIALDFLKESDVYKMVHHMDESRPDCGIENIRPYCMAESEYREKCRSVTPCMEGIMPHQQFTP